MGGDLRRADLVPGREYGGQVPVRGLKPEGRQEETQEQEQTGEHGVPERGAGPPRRIRQVDDTGGSADPDGEV